MNDEEISAAVRPLRFWLAYSGFGSRGERAKRHLDAFEAELSADPRDACDYCGPCHQHRGGDE